MQSSRRSVLIAVLVLLVVAQGAWIAYPHVRDVLFPSETTSAERGHEVAVSLGCFACHGPGGGGGVPNPGSKEGEVPAFTEQTQMMYVKSTDDLREYVLDGAPKRRRDDPDYVEQTKKAGLHMPAYRGFITDAQLEDLVSYLRATSGQIVPPDQPDEKLAAKGADIALAQGCFSCHGPLGAGGHPNPGSFKGYIPGFWGSDFEELVQNDDELREWIAEGHLDRIEHHPVGGVFSKRQRIQMAPYGDYLSAEDIDALVAYVKWIRAGSWKPLLR
jgi:mono/diheme cytochrome c family protein